MHPAVQEFVERMGRMMEADGLPRSAGRIFGFLLLAEAPFSLDELAEKLRVSKASVSTNARLLEQAGLLERSSAPGDRRDFYQMRPDAWEQMLRVARRRWETMQAALEDGEASLPPEMGVARGRLAEAARFHAFLLGEGESLLARWRAGEAADRAAAERRVS
ncbi:MAG: MarR family transcriptional regulator [Gemmatimonadota bacterium]